MQQSISYPTPERQPPTEPAATTSRLRTVTGNKFPRKCACGCGFGIPRDSEIRYVVDFGPPGRETTNDLRASAIGRQQDTPPLSTST
jgi:hypothetical protein